MAIKDADYVMRNKTKILQFESIFHNHRDQVTNLYLIIGDPATRLSKSYYIKTANMEK